MWLGKFFPRTKAISETENQTLIKINNNCSVLTHYRRLTGVSILQWKLTGSHFFCISPCTWFSYSVLKVFCFFSWLYILADLEIACPALFSRVFASTSAVPFEQHLWRHLWLVLSVTFGFWVSGFVKIKSVEFKLYILSQRSAFVNKGFWKIGSTFCSTYHFPFFIYLSDRNTVFQNFIENVDCMIFIYQYR